MLEKKEWKRYKALCPIKTSFKTSAKCKHAQHCKSKEREKKKAYFFKPTIFSFTHLDPDAAGGFYCALTMPERMENYNSDTSHILWLKKLREMGVK